jgi:integrase
VAKTIQKLSALFVGRVSKPGMHADGGGLYLQVTASGAKSWIYRYEHHGHERAMGLGSLNAVGLSEARTQAEECRGLRQRGIDPIEHRKEARVQAALDRANSISFAQAAQQYIEAHKSGWKNAKHASQWTNTIETHANPIIGALPVRAINTDLVMKVLSPIWNTIPETAGRLRGRIENILDWAKVLGFRTGENPARWRGHLNKLLPRKSKVRAVVHHPALSFAALPKFMPELRMQKGNAARALEFTILNATRTSETLDAEWSEFDFEGRTWTIPGVRMKGEVEHSVPLCARSLQILRKIREENPDSKFVFPGGKRGRPLSNMAMSNLLGRMGYDDITVHGFRSTFSDWAGETTNFADAVIEMSLAHHVDDKVKAAYRRGDLFQKRRRLLEAWEKYCASPPKLSVVRMSA